MQMQARSTHTSQACRSANTHSRDVTTSILTAELDTTVHGTVQKPQHTRGMSSSGGISSESSFWVFPFFSPPCEKRPIYYLPPACVIRGPANVLPRLKKLAKQQREVGLRFQLKPGPVKGRIALN